MSGAEETCGARQGHVFLSYSRRDAAFTRLLHDELTSRGRKTWADWEGIPPSDKWMARIHSAIDEAEAVLFIISPESLVSPVCGEELDFSFNRNKRVIPILHREPTGDVRKDLAEINWIFARPSDELREAVERMIEALDTDLLWVRAHTRLLVRAAEWDRQDRDASYSLRGRDLRDFETLQAEGTEKEPRLTRLQSEYLLASRRATTRRLQLTWGGATLAIIVASILGTLAWLQSEERARQAEIAGARRLVGQAEVLRETPEEAQTERRNGLRAAVQALATLKRVGADWTDADRAVRQSYASVDKWRDPFSDHNDWSVDNAAFSADPRHVLLYTSLNELVLLDMAEGEVLSDCRRAPDDLTESSGAANRRLALSPDARHAALRTSGGTNETGPWSRLEVWDLDTCTRVAKRQMGDRDPEEPQALGFNAEGTALLYGTRNIARSWRFADDAVASLKLSPDARNIAFGPDGRQAVVSVRANGERVYRMQVLDLASGAVHARWSPKGRVDPTAWGTGGILVSRPDDYAVMDPDGKLRGTFAGVPLDPPAFSKDGALIALWPETESGVDRRKVEVRAVATGELVARAGRNSDILAAAFNQDADTLVVVGDYGFDVEVWSFRENGAYARLTPRKGVDRIGFAVGGTLLHADHGGARTSWRLPEGAGEPPVTVPERETDAPPTPKSGAVVLGDQDREVLTAVHGAPDRHALLVCTEWTRGGCRRMLEVWEGGEKRANLPLEPLLDMDQSAFLQFAGNDAYLVVATRAGLQILDWRSLEQVGRLFVGDVRRVEVAPGLDRAATSGPDGAIRVWNLADNTEVARIESPDGISDMALSSDNRWLAVLTGEGDRIDLHALAPDDLSAQACRWLEPPCP